MLELEGHLKGNQDHCRKHPAHCYVSHQVAVDFYKRKLGWKIRNADQHRLVAEQNKFLLFAALNPSVEGNWCGFVITLPLKKALQNSW